MKLPSPAIEQKWSELSPLQQELYIKEYIAKRKTSGTAYLLWLFALHPLYFRKWGFQILYWLTAGGLGIWWLVDLFRIRGIVNRWNHSQALELFHKV